MAHDKNEKTSKKVMVNGKSNECAFGFCGRCSNPSECTCQCGHLSKDPLERAATIYNRHADKVNGVKPGQRVEHDKLVFRPGHLNLDKCDASTLFRAAAKIKDVDIATAEILRKEAEKRTPPAVKKELPKGAKLTNYRRAPRKPRPDRASVPSLAPTH